MPLYEYRCEKCGDEVELRREMKHRHKGLRCEECGGRMVKLVSTYKAKVFKPLTLEHINVDGEGPLTFNSENELRQYCRKHGLSSGALL